MSDVIRYGAGGKPYIGAVGDRSTEAIIVATEEKEPEVKIDFIVEEDDTPLTEEQVVIKAKGKKR